MVKYHHRVLDPGSMYAHAGDKFPPDLAECCKRAKIGPFDGKNEHEALFDAALVAACIEHKFGRNASFDYTRMKFELEESKL